MQPWQIVDFEGSLYYAFLPANHSKDTVEQGERNGQEDAVDIDTETKSDDTDIATNHCQIKVERDPEETETSIASVVFACSICDMNFDLENSLRQHNIRVHCREGEKYKCKACPKVCKTLISFKMHIALEHKNANNPLVFNCGYCNFECTKRTTLHSHIGRKHPARGKEIADFSCDVCEFTCQSKRRLKEHVERKHAADFKYACELCGKKFKVKGDMRLHVRFKHKEGPIICDVCGKTCSNSNSLYVHQKWAHFKPKYECHICHRRMVTQSNLDQHILLQHERRESFVCEECGKSFTENHRLKQHMMTHTGDRPHTCTICGKAFARRTAFRQHLLIHTGKRPYVCDICGKAFTQKPGLICHRKSHPGVHPPLPVVHIDHILNDFMKKNPHTGELDKHQGVFFFGKESVVMQEWQIFEFDGKPYYAFLPSEDAAVATNVDKHSQPSSAENFANEDESLKHESLAESEDGSDFEETENKPPLCNISGIELGGDRNGGKKCLGDLYQVKLEGNMVMIEKLAENVTESKTAGMDLLPISDTQLSSEPVFQTSEATVRSLKCKACSKTFTTEITFRKHVAWTHKKKVCIEENGAYVCAVCDFRSIKKSSFVAHLERKHETRSRSALLFPCQACGFVCRSKHSLQSHFTRKHTDTYEYPCKFCSKKFKVKGDLTTHVRFHHKEKPTMCDLCGKTCRNSGSLYVHQKWAHYKPKYECHICKRRMVTQENLDQHLLLQHEKKERIMCAECGKTFNKKDSFKRHMSIHTGNKPHLCPICSKPFARRSQLRQHLLIHTGKRPFVCDICGKAFTQKPGLICHRKTHPGPHPPLPVMPIGDIVNELAGIRKDSNE